MKCENCNRSIPNDSDFCQYCGFAIITQSKNEPNQETEFSPEDTKVENGASKKSYKTRFCKKCGASINLNTKICNGCGKQYFKINVKFSSNKIAGIFCILMFVTLIMGLIYQYQTISSLQSEVQVKANSITSLQGQLQSKQNQYDNLSDAYDELNEDNLDSLEKSLFLDSSIAFIVDNNTSVYHTYDCFNFKNATSYWAYNIEAAKSKGYSECWFCH